MLQYNIGLKGKTILVTGAAGFIGSNLCKRLLAEVEGAHIVGIDNMNDYYDVRLKEQRLEELLQYQVLPFRGGFRRGRPLRHIQHWKQQPREPVGFRDHIAGRTDSCRRIAEGL